MIAKQPKSFDAEEVEFYLHGGFFIMSRSLTLFASFRLSEFPIFSSLKNFRCLWLSRTAFAADDDFYLIVAYQMMIA